MRTSASERALRETARIEDGLRATPPTPVMSDAAPSYQHLGGGVIVMSFAPRRGRTPVEPRCIKERVLPRPLRSATPPPQGGPGPPSRHSTAFIDWRERTSGTQPSKCRIYRLARAHNGNPPRSRSDRRAARGRCHSPLQPRPGSLNRKGTQARSARALRPRYRAGKTYNPPAPRRGGAMGLRHDPGDRWDNRAGTACFPATVKLDSRGEGSDPDPSA